MHGNIVLSNVVAVALVTLYLLTVYNTHHLELYTTRACAWLAHMVTYLLSTIYTRYLPLLVQGYYTSMAMFVWMTIFCFDLCSTFTSSTHPSREGNTRHSFHRWN